MSKGVILNARLKLLRRVTATYATGATTEHLIRTTELTNFIIAMKRLHVDPGINPYTGVATDRITKIVVEQLYVDNGAWWTSPDLKDGRSVSPNFYWARPLIVFEQPTWQQLRQQAQFDWDAH